ncbi:hypothetical protein B0H11DRAFT_2076662 [Mycena galericulata]|nr:hypothetical protein B0H11DRAFT_2076662 [Mycena galericulata]
MAVSADVAQELIDGILDFLYDDRASLLSSSLVARKWVPATRHHLFARIAVHHFLAGRLGFKDNAHSFLEICGSPHCSILPSIRTVVLDVDTEFTPVGPDPGLMVNIIGALAHSPLEKIIFIDHTSSLSQPVSLSWIGPHFPGLRELSYNALERTTEDIFALVSSFPALRVLSVYSSYKDSPTASIAHGLAPHPTFAHLNTLRTRLYSYQSEELFSWLQSTGHPFQLETLDVNIFHCYHNGWGAVTALNSFLRANGEHLRDLAICVTYEDSDHEVDEIFRVEKPAEGELDLSGLTSLRSLRLTGHNVEAICVALGSVDSPGLDTLRVDFLPWIYYEEAPCECDPSVHVHLFAAVMQTDQFARLTMFHIGVPDFFGESGKAVLKDFFGWWKDSEVVRVAFSEIDYQIDAWETLRSEMFGIA